MSGSLQFVQVQICQTLTSASVNINQVQHNRHIYFFEILDSHNKVELLSEKKIMLTNDHIAEKIQSHYIEWTVCLVVTEAFVPELVSQLHKLFINT